MLEAFPFDVKAEENARADGDHQNHGKKLRLVAQCRAEQLSCQHLRYQSTSSALSGDGCSSQDVSLPFFTRRTTSAILAMF